MQRLPRKLSQDSIMRRLYNGTGRESHIVPPKIAVPTVDIFRHPSGALVLLWTVCTMRFAKKPVLVKLS